MPLTPEDVSNKRFTAVRLREGYDMGEVDAFLDEVEAELTRLHSENEELRTKLEAALAGQPVEHTAEQPAAAQQEPATQAAEAPAPTTTTPATATPATAAPEAAADVPGDTPVTSLAKPGGVETLRVSTTAEASAAATRLLELATRSADELMSDAQAQAENILSSARADAERVEQDARNRAQQLDVETNQRREQLFSNLERDRNTLSTEVENLRTFEREYRTELKDYFAKQLEALEHPLANSERFGSTADGTGSRIAGNHGTTGA